MQKKAAQQHNGYDVILWGFDGKVRKQAPATPDWRVGLIKTQRDLATEQIDVRV